MTRLDRWHEAPAAPARRGVHIWGALRTPSAAAAASGHLDQIGGTRGVPGGGSSGGSRLRATRHPGGNSSVCRRSAHSSFRCWLVGSTSAHVPRGGGRTQGHGRGARSEDSVGRTGAPTLAAGSPPRREARTLRGRDPSARPHCAPSCQRPGLSRAARLRARPAVLGHSVHGRGGLGLWRELGFLSASRTVHQLMNGEPWLQTHHTAEGHKGHVRPGPDAPTWPDPPPPTGH